jgi:hypothetical protein
MQSHTTHGGHKSCRRIFTVGTSAPCTMLFGLLKEHLEDGRSHEYEEVVMAIREGLRMGGPDF